MSVMYLALRTRPDILQQVSYIASNITNREKWVHIHKQLIIIATILRNTPDKYLIFRRAEEHMVVGYADASFITHEDGKSHTGFSIWLSNRFNTAAIIVKSHKQVTVSASSTEAELIAGHEATRNLIWAKDIITFLDNTYDNKPVILHQDNKSAVCIIKYKYTNKNSRFINVKYLSTRDLLENKLLTIVWVKGSQMWADVLTKPVTKSKYDQCITRIMGTYEEDKEK